MSPPTQPRHPTVTLAVKILPWPLGFAWIADFLLSSAALGSCLSPATLPHPQSAHRTHPAGPVLLAAPIRLVALRADGSPAGRRLPAPALVPVLGRRWGWGEKEKGKPGAFPWSKSESTSLRVPCFPARALPNFCARQTNCSQALPARETKIPRETALTAFVGSAKKAGSHSGAPRAL